MGGGGRGYSGGYVGGSIGSSFEDALRAAQADMYRGAVFVATSQELPKPDPNKPPKSYIKAKEAVESWLIEPQEQSFEDIVGNEEALGQIRDAIEAPIKFKELYEAYGMKMPKGALLRGPPGCGKTMFARAAASEIRKLYGGDKGTVFLAIKGTQLQSPYVGITETYIQQIFLFAREYKKWHGHPLLIFIDEAEVLLPDRTGRVRRVSSWEEAQVATFIAEMDGVEESGAFVMLASNRAEVIDEAVLRDGRVDFKVTIKRPTVEAAEIILTRHFDKVLIKSETKEHLVFAALESLYDPAKVIMEYHALGIDFQAEKIKELKHKHFCLEHIISGSMLVSIPARATGLAFRRDKETPGVITGVTTMDVINAINNLFEENRFLEHSYALSEFRENLLKEVYQEEKDARS